MLSSPSCGGSREWHLQLSSSWSPFLSPHPPLAHPTAFRPQAAGLLGRWAELSSSRKILVTGKWLSEDWPLPFRPREPLPAPSIPSGFLTDHHPHSPADRVTFNSPYVCKRDPISPHSCQHLLFVLFLMIDGYEVISHYDFDLHFSDDKWCWASFHLLIGHWSLFFGDISNQTLCPSQISF